METHAIFTYLGLGQFQLELDDRQLLVGTLRLVNIQLGRTTSSALGREWFVDSAHFCLVFCLQRQGFGLWLHQRQMDRFIYSGAYLWAVLPNFKRNFKRTVSSGARQKLAQFAMSCRTSLNDWSYLIEVMTVDYVMRSGAVVGIKLTTSSPSWPKNEY